ncbi:UAA transporter family-domain-containing protein [Lactarius sanguifluus]|nr:UAA transporter family-domain-containing protein [Lactarius sanguifluus]
MEQRTGMPNQMGTPPLPGSHSQSQLLLRYLQCSLFITFAAPFGFAALSHVSYPAMVLAKSCKLVPVMVMNVILYRRAFARHKYIVVALVTVGITMFMGFGGDGGGKQQNGRPRQLDSAAYDHWDGIPPDQLGPGWRNEIQRRTKFLHVTK